MEINKTGSFELFILVWICIGTFPGLLFVHINSKQKLIQQMEVFFIVNEYVLQDAYLQRLIKCLQGALVTHIAHLCSNRLMF